MFLNTKSGSEHTGLTTLLHDLNSFRIFIPKYYKTHA